MDHRQSEVHTLAVDARAQTSEGIHDERTLTTINHKDELRANEA